MAAVNRLQPLYYITNFGPTAPGFLNGVENLKKQLTLSVQNTTTIQRRLNILHLR